jgi:hypothetical protein
MYYPKSQIKEKQYTNGGEFIISSTKKDYTGYYFSTSKGEYFTGKNPSDKPNNQLILSVSPIQNVTNDPIVEPFDTVENYYLIDDSYYKAKGLATKRNAPRAPIQTLGKPTDKDIQNGFFYRYFVKKGNEGQFIEISKEEHLKFQNKDTLVQWQLYTPTRIKWDIQGNREQVYNGNKTVVSLTEQRENLPGFTLFFRGQFDKFWIGK